MSDVKYQLKKLLPSLSSDARSMTNESAKIRYKILKYIVESPKAIAATCRQSKRSEAWFYKWAERLINKGSLSALEDQSRAPKHSPKKTTRRTTKKIKQLREQHPYAGKETISQDLKDLFNINCPPSTVGHVLRREKLVASKKQKRSKPHNKRYRRQQPGYLQMDFKYVPYKIMGVQYYQLSAVDHHSSWRLIRMYPQKDRMAVMDFVEHLRESFPFAIIEIQTDNDTAFTDKFSSGVGVTGDHYLDRWCAKHDISHRLIPPGVKELNGKVENTHRQDEREFYSQIRAHSFDHLQAAAQWYNERWNKRRKTKTLGWLTPEQAVEQAFIARLAWLQLIAQAYPDTRRLPLHINDQGTISLQIPNPSPQPKPDKKKKSRTPRKTYLSRYLDELNWDGRSRKKA